jgi:hypothetical protein
MNAKLTALGLFVGATLALAAHAESQSEWLLKQLSQTDGSITTIDNQPAPDSRPAEAKKSDVKRFASPAEDQSVWLRKQLSQTDGSPMTIDSQSATVSRYAKAK